MYFLEDPARWWFGMSQPPSGPTGSSSSPGSAPGTATSSSPPPGRSKGKLATAVAVVVIVCVVVGLLFSGVVPGFHLSSSSSSAKSPPSYAVTFSESGLPSSTTWSVTFNGSLKTSATSSIAFTSPNGTWPFTVGTVTSYSASPASGHVTVSGVPATQDVSFTSGSSVPIGTAFAFGNPVASTCHSGYTYATNGCSAGDYTYQLTIESSSVHFNDVLFEIRTSAGAIYTLPAGTGGFSIINITGQLAAQSSAIATGAPMNMTTTWTAYGPGISGSSSLTNIFSILLDMGTNSPSGEGLALVAFGTNGYLGTTSPLPLP